MDKTLNITATCIDNFIRRGVVVEAGDTVNVQIKIRENHMAFRIGDSNSFFKSWVFFAHFKTDCPEIKMTNSDFKYIIINYLFKMACFYNNDLGDGRYVMVGDDWTGKVIMIYVEKTGETRVYFSDTQENYSSLEAALEGIRNHKTGK